MGLAGVGVPVQLLGGEAGDTGAQHGHVVPDEEDGEPLPQVPLDHTKLAVSGPGELEGQAGDHLEGALAGNSEHPASINEGEEKEADDTTEVSRTRYDGHRGREMEIRQ